jgi:hypothetical protein
MARNVVGICSTATPRRYVAAAKPAMSPVTPPPSATTASVRVRRLSLRKRSICPYVSSVFDPSPGGKAMRATAKPASVCDFSTVSP